MTRRASVTLREARDSYDPQVRAGSALAEGIRDEAQERAEGRGPWSGVTRVCRRCQRQSLSLEDGECPGCAGDAEAEYEHQRARREAGRRQLYRDTALLLRRAGELERAAYWDMRAEGRW